MLTDYRGNKILVAYNVRTCDWTVKWGVPSTNTEFSSHSWNSPRDAIEYAKQRIVRDSALTVHKAQRREDSGDVLFLPTQGE
jgi:hypothetical protein